MDPRDILASLRHAWYVLLLGLLLATAASYFIITQTGPEYETQASVVLVPGDAVIPENSNPFLYLGGGTALRDVLVRVLTSDEASDTILAQRSSDTTYEVGPDPTTAGPILLASTSAPTEAEALATLEDVLKMVPTSLEDVQESRDVPAAARFTSMVLAQEQRASVNRSGMIRLLVAAVGAIGVLTLFAAAWLDGRRRRAAPKHASAPVQTQSEASASDEARAVDGSVSTTSLERSPSRPRIEPGVHTATSRTEEPATDGRPAAVTDPSGLSQSDSRV
jgi:hypothetical protein